MSSPEAGLRKGQLLMDPECHLRVVCVPFPSLGLGLDPQRLPGSGTPKCRHLLLEGVAEG